MFNYMLSYLFLLSALLIILVKAQIEPVSNVTDFQLIYLVRMSALGKKKSLLLFEAARIFGFTCTQ